MVNDFSRSASLKSISFNKSTSCNKRALNIGSPRVSQYGCVSRCFQMLLAMGSVLTFAIAIGGGYIYVVPSLSQAFFHINDVSDFSTSCNISSGRWVQVTGYPLYNATECPFVEQGFNCLANGRNDKDYLRWRWKPWDCKIPTFDVHNILEMLRSKRVVFVGDSMSRTQWESLICMLMTGVEDKSSVYEVNQNKITKRIRFLGVRFSAFNFTIEFFRSVFLVQQGPAPKHAPRRVSSALKLDRLDGINEQWVDSDILIFNTGHWWVPSKLFDMGCYFQIGDSLKLGMLIPTAYRVALQTWASWVEKSIDANKTLVFFRTFEPAHWRDQTRRTCSVTQYPTLQTNGSEQSQLSDIVLEVVKNMKVPVTVLHVTSMSAFRSDAHVGNWSDNPSVPDCSHWCLPGAPDMWNEIVLSLFFAAYQQPLSKEM